MELAGARDLPTTAGVAPDPLEMQDMADLRTPCRREIETDDFETEMTIVLCALLPLAVRPEACAPEIGVVKDTTVGIAADHGRRLVDTGVPHQGVTQMTIWACLVDHRTKYLTSRFWSSTKVFLG